MTEEEPAPKPKRRIWLIVLLAIGIPALCGLVCCGGLGYWAIDKFKDLPGAILNAQAFLGDLSANRVDEAYQRTSQGYKATTTLDKLRALVAKYPAFAGSSNTQFSGVRMEEDPGVKKAVLNTVVANSTASVSCTITLVKEDNVWRVDGFTVP